MEVCNNDFSMGGYTRNVTNLWRSHLHSWSAWVVSQSVKRTGLSIRKVTPKSISSDPSREEMTHLSSALKRYTVARTGRIEKSIFLSILAQAELYSAHRRMTLR